jgi:hypothetical protein
MVLTKQFNFNGNKMTTLNWTISQLDCIPQESEKTDVVVTAHWVVSITDGTYTSSLYGTKSFTYNAQTEFIPYNELTLEQVVRWVQTAMSTEELVTIQDKLEKQLVYQATPSIVTSDLPWELGTNTEEM